MTSAARVRQMIGNGATDAEVSKVLEEVQRTAIVDVLAGYAVALGRENAMVGSDFFVRQGSWFARGCIGSPMDEGS